MEEQLQKEKIWTKDFVLICLANFFIFLGFQMTLPTIPLFVEDLGGNDQLIGFVVGIFTFSALLLRPYAGTALETKGRRFVYIIGLTIFVLSVGSFGFLTSIVLLFMMRVVQGGGWGFSTTASGTIASDLIPVSRRGEGMGFYGLSGNLALAIGPSLGLTLTGIINFKPFFLICAGLGLIALILSSRISYKKIDPKPGMEKTKSKLYEKGALKPSILMFFITVTFGGIAAFLPLYTAEKHISGIQLYFLFYALALMITRSFAGKLYDRKGLVVVFIPGTFLILIAMILLAWLPNSLILYTAATFYGLGFGMVQPALQSWSIEKVPVNRRGMATATFYSFFDLGIGLGAMGFGQISHLLGYSSIYWTSAVSIAISMLLYLYFLYRDRLSVSQKG
ncbi:MFS transporter [Bacillus sp. AFS076308]|uniref:MFS transporter n=1 Tax=unclassified Bacillus (in: firmicutes) TaxID=185979 RepID=UPI000BF945F1|nr:MULTISPECIES: MFS transporter [unclassified Bacillus (in: firmicutes)]PFN97496.1 MFS transporter [Bacillus sp. AFS076308]PGV46523.1 MFS transporter [Bacillus sp. AFS037270]